MVLKNLTRKSDIKQLFYYVFEKERINIHPEFDAIHIRHNVRSKQIDKIIKEFEVNERYRLRSRKDSVLINHTIISFNELDTSYLTEKVLKDLANKFISLRGEKIQYSGVVHLDKNHLHVHILYPGIELCTGKSNRISKSQFKNIKLELDRYQREKYPELIHSLPGHGVSNLNVLNVKKDLRLKYERNAPLKAGLIKEIEKAINNSISLPSFVFNLESQGLEPYYRGGKLTGVISNTRKFRFKTVGLPIYNLNFRNERDIKEEKILNTIKSIRHKNIIEKEISSPDR